MKTNLQRSRFTSVLAALLLGLSLVAADAPQQNLVDRVNRRLRLVPTQEADIDPIVSQHEDRIEEIRHDNTIPKPKKVAKIRALYTAMLDEIRPHLQPSQSEDLAELREELIPPPYRLRIAVEYTDFVPTGSQMRSIFGSSESYFSLSLADSNSIGRRNRVGFTLDGFGLSTNSNKLFVFAPEAFYEHRVPIGKAFAFAQVAGGPAYMDYTFDTPDQQHFGAKRAGLDASAEIGLRYGPLRFGVAYRAFTQPAGINFNGVEYSVACTVFQF